MELSGKKFVASYSGGKDSCLAFYRALNSGLAPLSLFTTYNTDASISWFHGLPERILSQVTSALDVPVKLIKTTGEDYSKNFEAALRDFKIKGAQVCVFGDIDIEEHRKWCSERCENQGIIPYFPLWNEPRRDLVYEFIDSGFKTIISTVDTSRLSGEFAGKTLTREVAGAIEKEGADICGENGEYHSFVYDGPVFSKVINFSIAEIAMRGKYKTIRFL